MGTQTVADLIIEHLKVYSSRTPQEIANMLGLVSSTVRRTTKELANAGEIVEVTRHFGAPVYRLAVIEAEASTCGYKDPAQ